MQTRSRLKPPKQHVGSARQFRTVATIKELNRQARTAVIEDARGRSHTIRDVKPEKFDGVSVGDVGIVVFTEAIAISVQRLGGTGSWVCHFYASLLQFK